MVNRAEGLAFLRARIAESVGAHGHDRDITIRLRSCYARVLWNHDVEDGDLLASKTDITEAVPILEDTARYLRRTFGAKHVRTIEAKREIESARKKLALLEIWLSGDEELIEPMARANGYDSDEAPVERPAASPPPPPLREPDLAEIVEKFLDGPGL
jgi:hypothetical protein